MHKYYSLFYAPNLVQDEMAFIIVTIIFIKLNYLVYKNPHRLLGGDSLLN